MTPIEVINFCKARADYRRRDVIERSWTTGMFSGLAFGGKLEGMDRYLPGNEDASKAPTSL